MIIQVEKLSKAFGGIRAVNDVSFTLNRNEIRALIGPNGAGKTTFFKLLAGNLTPDSGKITYENEDITAMKTYEIYHKSIHKTFQHLNLYPKLTAFEGVQLALLSQNKKNWDFFSITGRMYNREIMDVLHSVELDNKSHMQSRFLSHGEKRRLDLAIALAGTPKLLLLDEAASGLDPLEAHEVMELIVKLARERELTVCFIEHDMSVVFGMAEKISVLHLGEIIAEGSSDEIKNNEMVKKIYLGE
jgi:branched-chain amino acid transport system ATP-binding protein